MLLHRFFTKNLKPKEDPSRLFQWRKQKCEIVDAESRVLFSMPSVRAPKHWSALAVDIAASKYFRKKGMGKNQRESSIEQMLERVVNAIFQSGLRQKYFLAPVPSKGDKKNQQKKARQKNQARIFADELKYALLDQRVSFNSPVWFNCGLYESYGVTSRGTQWAWDAKKRQVVNVGEAYARPQVSACFIQGVDDNLESIFDLAKTEARLFKFGSGSGTNFSRLRSRWDLLEGGGQSSGLISFLEVLDRGAGSVKSGGTTRRAAKMVCLDIDHPEILDFIQWKKHEERKAKFLSQAGYGRGMDSEAYRTVSGQNSNNSVRVTAAFMRAVEKDGLWGLRSPLTKKVLKKIKARELWSAIAESAWLCADPGLQFEPSIQNWHTCKSSGPIRASNPCSEFMFLDDSACNLASLNLPRFLKDGNFELEAFLHGVRLLILAQEILVDHAGYPTQKIAENSHQFRPLGLGLAGLGAFLMRQGIAYDSELGRAWAACLTSLMSAQAHLVSAEIAQSRGAYHGYRKNKGHHLKVLRRHCLEAKKMTSTVARWQEIPTAVREAAKNLWLEACVQAEKHGLRNSQLTLMAPTGTIGLVMDSDTTGIEPEFSLVKMKKLSGGGQKKIVSQSLAEGLRQLKYSPDQIQKIMEHVEVHGRLDQVKELKKDHQAIFATAMQISPEGHLQMMAAIQPFVCGAISKTINLPQKFTVADIEKLHFSAWKLGLKSVAIYRDGSKMDQPLTSFASSASPETATGSAQTTKCTECGSDTEFSGGCLRCVNCGSTMSCS